MQCSIIWARDRLLDDFEYATIDRKFGQERKERPEKHDSTTEEAVGKVYVRGDAVVK